MPRRLGDLRLALIPITPEHCTLIKGNNKPLVSAARKYEVAAARSEATHDSVVKNGPTSLLLSDSQITQPPSLL